MSISKHTYTTLCSNVFNENSFSKSSHSVTEGFLILFL